jgi:hypothetical protein
MDLREIEWAYMGWIYLAQDKENWMAFVNTEMNLHGVIKVRKFLSGYATGGFSKEYPNSCSQ